MKKTAMAFSNILRSNGLTASQALRFAWKMVKANLGAPVTIEFAKVSTGEVRSATVKSFSQPTKKGLVKFVELLPDGKTQWRAFYPSALLAI